MGHQVGHVQPDGFVFEKKPVYDWNHVAVGEIQSTRRDPKTNATRRLVLTLTPEAQTELGMSRQTLELPASLVFGMRRDQVTLDRSIGELKKIDQLESILLK